MEWLNWTESEVGLIFTIRTTKWLVVGWRGTGRTWLSWDGLSVSQRISYPPANSWSSSKGGFRVQREGDLKHNPSLVFFEFVHVFLTKPVHMATQIQIWANRPLLDQRIYTVSLEKFGLSEASNLQLTFFFFNLPDSLQIYLVVIFIIFYGYEYSQSCLAHKRLTLVEWTKFTFCS